MIFHPAMMATWSFHTWASLHPCWRLRTTQDPSKRMQLREPTISPMISTSCLSCSQTCLWANWMRKMQRIHCFRTRRTFETRMIARLCSYRPFSSVLPRKKGFLQIGRNHKIKIKKKKWVQKDNKGILQKNELHPNLFRHFWWNPTRRAIAKDWVDISSCSQATKWYFDPSPFCVNCKLRYPNCWCDQDPVWM